MKHYITYAYEGGYQSDSACASRSISYFVLICRLDVTFGSTSVVVEKQAPFIWCTLMTSSLFQIYAVLPRLWSSILYLPYWFNYWFNSLIATYTIVTYKNVCTLCHTKRCFSTCRVCLSCPVLMVSKVHKLCLSERNSKRRSCACIFADFMLKKMFSLKRLDCLCSNVTIKSRKKHRIAYNLSILFIQQKSDMKQLFHRIILSFLNAANSKRNKKYTWYFDQTNEGLPS